MSNPIFNALGGNMQENNIISQIKQFKEQMQGVNPQEEINKLLQSGKISQQQLNEAQQMAQQMQNLFNNVQ